MGPGILAAIATGGCGTITGAGREFTSVAADRGIIENCE